MAKKLFVKTHGCQMNEYDSARMYDVLRHEQGYEIAETEEEADVLLLNTCSIREKAQEKVFHQLGRWQKLKNANPDLVIGVGGCVASQEGDAIMKRAPAVDVVFGPQTIHRLPGMLSAKKGQLLQVVDVTFPEVEKFDRLPEPSVDGPAAFLSIMEGCSKYCTFCVVPYTRGDEVSRSFDSILYEVKNLATNGTKEIILLGQNVNSYSSKNFNGENVKLSDLIRYISLIPGIDRIRYTTSHPRDMTDDLIECYKNSKKLMPFVHLPIQSGSDRILKMMNRKHTVNYYLNIYEKLIKINPDIKFSSDFIIGYPGEEEEDFNATFELIQKIKFINSYSFIFSPRPGTVAADLKLIDKKISMERLEKIQSQLYDNQMHMNKSLENETINVLVENLTDDKTQVFGRSEYMTSVIFNGKKDDIGKIMPVKINKSNRSTLFGDRDLSYKQKVA